ncbi:MAG: Type secretion system protein [Pseudomonadota bacterium]|jgi:type II secretory pathway component PulM
MNYREKVVISSGIILAVILIGYGWIWLPYQAELITLQKRVVLYQNDLAWMKQAASQFKPLDKDVFNFIQQRLQTTSVNLTRNENKTLQLTFEKMDFALLIQLLADLHQHYHISATTITLETHETETVKGLIILPLDP